MRKIDWEAPLSEDDIAFLRQMGVQGMEERIEGHQNRFGEDVPETPETPDPLTASALDAQSRASVPVPTDGGPRLVDPTEADPQDSDVDSLDDYDRWKVSELEADVQARNDMPDTTSVNVTGTGKDGKVLKQDLIDGLRQWDRENPDALA